MIAAHLIDKEGNILYPVSNIEFETGLDGGWFINWFSEKEHRASGTNIFTYKRKLNDKR